MSQKKLPAKKLKGFQDIFGQQMNRRWQIMSQVVEHGKRAGFELMHTPTLEYAETLLGQGGETDKQAYLFEDNGKRKIGMRFDLTMPLARFVVENHNDLVFPFKRIQMGSVFRAEKPQKGRYREFGQCDFDIIGVESAEADIEIVACLSAVLRSLPIGAFTVHVGHRKVLSSLMQSTLLADGFELNEAMEKAVLIAIDKLEKVGQEKVTQLIKEACEEKVDVSQINLLLEAIEPEKNNELTFDKIAKRLQDKDVLQNLYTTLEGLAILAESKTIKLDLRIARGLAYYTGVVFETTLNDIPEFGSICSGGRYDDLVDRFSSQKMPGVGGSIGLDRLLAAMEELDIKKPGSESSREGVFVALATPNASTKAMELVKSLRDAGAKAELSLKQNKLNKQLAFANKKHARYAVVIGDQELEEDKFKVKDLQEGSQSEPMNFEELVRFLKK